MLQVEHPYNEDNNLIRHYSDANHMIEQVETGILYAEAVDVYPSKYTYRETDEPIPNIEQEEQ